MESQRNMEENIRNFAGINVPANSHEILENFNGLVQERCNSSALAMELQLSCTNPSICRYNDDQIYVLFRYETDTKKMFI